MRKRIDYGTGALITIVISIGVMLIAYGGGYFPFDLFKLPAWVFGPLGVYTLISILFYQSEVFSARSLDLAWSLVFLTITVISLFYNVVNILVVIGFLFIGFGVLASIANLKQAS